MDGCPLCQLLSKHTGILHLVHFSQNFRSCISTFCHCYFSYQDLVITDPLEPNSVSILMRVTLRSQHSGEIVCLKKCSCKCLAFDSGHPVPPTRSVVFDILIEKASRQADRNMTPLLRVIALNIDSTGCRREASVLKRTWTR